MKSITGIEFNNHQICIKGNGNFACVCEKCMNDPEIQERLKMWLEKLEPPQLTMKSKLKE